VEGVWRDDDQVAFAAGASLVTDADDELAAEDAEHLIASVQVHLAGLAGR
jgi:hypothetical protein